MNWLTYVSARRLLKVSLDRERKLQGEWKGACTEVSIICRRGGDWGAAMRSPGEVRGSEPFNRTPIEAWVGELEPL